MNPGYAAYVLAGCSFVLLSLGWKRELFGELNASKLAVWLTAWAIGLCVPLRFGAWLESSGAMVVGACLSAAILLHPQPDYSRPVTMLNAAVLATFAAVLAYMGRWGGIYAIHPFADLIVVAALAATWKARRVEQQAAVLWLGLAAGEMTERLLAGGLLRIGFGAFWDRWWAAFLLARLLSVLLALLEQRRRRASL